MRRVALICLVFALGCDDLKEFRIRGDEVFEGAVVGSDSVDASDQPGCEFVLCGFSERTTLTLRNFDPDLAGGDDTTGTLSTSDGKLDRARLLPLAGLQHDALSQYTFPGGGRVRNYILGVRFGDNDARYAMVFLSLMEDGRIEVRMHAPASTVDGTDELFGVFRLCRGGCAP